MDIEAVEVAVTDIMLSLGVPAHISGYRYLRNAIVLSVGNMDLISAMTKQLYPAVAEKYGSTPSRVERSIRHAVEMAWDRGDIDTLQKFFGSTVSRSRGKPTNSEFIAMIADHVTMEMKRK